MQFYHCYPLQYPPPMSDADRPARESPGVPEASPRRPIDITTVLPRSGWGGVVRHILRQPWFTSLGLFMADLLLISGAYFISREIRVSQQLNMSAAYLLQISAFFACILIAVALIGGYKERRTFQLLHFTAEFILAVLIGAAAGTFVLFVFFSAGDFYSAQSRVVLFYTAIGYAIPALGLRVLAAAMWTHRARRIPFLAIGSPVELDKFEQDCRRMNFDNPVVLAGTDLRVLREFTRDRTHFPRVSPHKIICDAAQSPDEPPVAKAPGIMPDFEGIILTDPPENYPRELLEKLARLHFLRIPVYTEETFFSEVWHKELIHRLDHSWAIRQNFQLARHSVYRYLKICVDYALVILLLPLALPLLLLAALGIVVDSGFPVFYRQERVGRGERRFTLLKLRSMHVREDEDDPYTRRNDQRITRMGRLMRVTRLDELPQIFNVLRGDMSFVGPRAEWSRIVADYEKKIPSYHLRHLVKPGITGWAQVNYRYGTDLDDAVEKLRYDLYYIKNYSLVLDIEILFKTILKICSFGGR